MPLGLGYVCSRMSSGLNADTVLWAGHDPEAVGRVEIPQCGGLLRHRDVLSYKAEARSWPAAPNSSRPLAGSSGRDVDVQYETTQIHRTARRRGGRVDRLSVRCKDAAARADAPS